MLPLLTRPLRLIQLHVTPFLLLPTCPTPTSRLHRLCRATRSGLAGLLASSLLLLIGGSLGMAKSGRWLGLIGLYSFTACYSTSLGALVWVLVSEVR